MLDSMGRLLIAAGIVLVLVGVGLMLSSRLPLLGHLPGDIIIKRGNISLFIPLATSVILSLLLTIVLNVILRLLNR